MTIRLNNFNIREQENSSDSNFSISPSREQNINTRNFNLQSIITGNNSETSSVSEISYSSVSSNENDEISINISEDITNNLLNSENICLICANEYKDVCKLRCGHKICLSCLINWFRQSNTCPFCREKINNINFNYLYPRNESIERDINYQSNTNNSQCNLFRMIERSICCSSVIYWSFIILSHSL